jgi:hypothetical protein
VPQNWDMRRVDTGGDHCPECGGQVKGGRGGCQALFDEITYMMGSNLRIAAIHRLSLDTYCMQHVESYCASARSYAAHLVGLWWGINHPDDSAPVVPVLRSLNLNDKLIKPPVLRNRGSISLPDVMTGAHPASDIDEFVRHVHAWANNVWQAYDSQHEMIRMWIK